MLQQQSDENKDKDGASTDGVGKDMMEIMIDWND